MGTQVLRLVIDARDKASAKVEALAVAAKKAGSDVDELGAAATRTEQKLDGLNDELAASEKAWGKLGGATDEAGDGLSGVGKAAGKAGTDAKKASMSVRQLEEGMGETSSIAGGLASGLDQISPAAGGAVRVLGDMAGAVEMVGRSGAGLAGPLAVLTLAVTVAFKVWEKYNQKQVEAQEEMERTREEAEALQLAMNSWDLSKANAQVKLMAAEGKITNKELKEYEAHTMANAAATEVLTPLMEKQTAQLKKFEDAQAAVTAAREEFNNQKGGAGVGKAGKALEEAKAALDIEDRSLESLARQIGVINDGVTKHANTIIAEFDAVNAAADKAKKTSGGGKSKDVDELGKMVDQANKLSQAPADRLNQLNAELMELHAAAAQDEAAAARLAGVIGQVTTARDAELQAYNTKAAEEHAKALTDADSKTQALSKSVDGLVAAFEEPVSAADKLRARKGELAKQWDSITTAAEASGIAGTAGFQEMAGSFEIQMQRIQAAIHRLEPPSPESWQEHLGAGLKGLGSFLTAGGGKDGGGALGAAEGAMGVIASGGASALAAAAGPAGGLVSGALALGQQGDAAYDAEVDRKAQEAAAERAEGMQSKADQMAAGGATQEQIDAAGYGQEDIAEAGQVTQEDEMAAAADTDRGEMMGDVVKQAVEGVIDGIKSIIVGLPDILAELIPMLLTELPAALIASTLKMIPKLVVAIVRDIPVGIYKGAKRAFHAVWSAIKSFFRSVFSLGIMQSGGYIPKTGSYVLHQGERVVPSSGASTGAAQQGLQAFAGGSSNLTIQTSVVDPDTIPALTRIMEQHMGSMGRTTSPLLGAQSPVTEI
jgi:hypothetical protein